MALGQTIDSALDLADHDAAAKILDCPDRVLWLVYRLLHDARHFRIADAQFQIQKLAPRKVAP